MTLLQLSTRAIRRSLPVAGLSASLLAALPAASLHAQASADAAYDRVARSWSGTKTLQADFTQVITNPLLGRTAKSRGIFQQQRPNRVSITFLDPVGDRIVGDGTSLWVYLPSSAPGQVLKLPANADGAIVADIMGQLLDTPRRNFTISGGEAAAIDGRATRRVQLVPKTSGSVPFRRATIWVDDKEARPVRVQVVDEQGVDRLITLTSWKPGVSLPANTFRFTPPKGVKVATKLPGQ